MDDQANGPGGDDRGEAPVSAWLDELAESEGLTRSEALERLVSSYWRLEEISTLLAEGEGDRPGSHAETPAGAVGDALDWPEDDSGAEGSADFDRLVALVAVLADRVQGLETTLKDRVDEPDAAAPQPEAAAPADELEALTERVEALDDALASMESTAITKDELAEELDEAMDSLTIQMGQQEALRDLVRTEFRHIRTILEHLVDSSASSEDRTERLAAELRDSVRPHLEDQSAVAELKRAANEADVASADCSNCGHSVDLSLLERPRCPACRATLTDIATTTGVFGLFQRAVLSTEDD